MRSAWNLNRRALFAYTYLIKLAFPTAVEC